jgi:hypothetical protein
MQAIPSEVTPRWGGLSGRVRFDRTNGLAGGRGGRHGAVMLCLPDDRRFDPVQSILPTGPAVALNRVHTTRGPVRRRASLIVVTTKISPCEAASGRSLVN